MTEKANYWLMIVDNTAWNYECQYRMENQFYESDVGEKWGISVNFK